MAELVDKINLRDARHAHQIYTQGGLDFAPKVKFLYHVVFTITPAAVQNARNTGSFLKQLSTLVKTADLPSYSTQIETKKQYNRIKNMQTRIDYDPVNITMHDDNVGITTKMLEEYYRYYYQDGNKFGPTNNVKDFEPRDKYGKDVHRYGLDGAPDTPFFKDIVIYQLARQEWTSYTLINPLIEKFQHDSVDASDGVGMLQNALTVVYEGVIYNRGSVGSEPTGFADGDTGYDLEPSYLNGSISSQRTSIKDRPTRIPSDSGPLVKFRNDSVPGGGSIIRDVIKDPGGFSNFTFPARPSTNPISTLAQSADRLLDGDSIADQLRRNPSLARTFTNQSVSTGQVENFAVSTLNTFNQLPNTQRSAITDELINKVSGGDKKLQQIGSSILKGLF
ncbi:MAG: hypothetical protein CMC73_07635 [Flavobacteriaceae bacterium]|nr:hypothetical protein [Flavobacteriaceae bacterium]